MISEKLQSIIRRELDLDQFDFRDDTTAPQVPGWDSLNHVRILAAVEQAYGVRFRSLEAVRLKNIGELQRLIDKKLAS
jgi:acyl carrier protein